MTGAAMIAAGRASAIRRYTPGRPASRPAGKLSSNEAPLGPSPRVRAAISRAANEAHRYPTTSDLREELAVSLALTSDRIVLTNGSDELCYLIAMLFVGPGARVLMSDPGYRVDEIVTRIQHGQPEFVPLCPDGSHDVAALAAVARSAALVWIPSPHNPTGVAVAPEKLAAFLATVPSNCLVVLDEAYRNYVEPARRPDVPALLEEFPNLLVQRTFSKDFALAGLRIGYGLGSPETIDAIEAIRPPFNVNVAAVAGARAALADEAWREYATALVCRERERLMDHLTMLGLEYFPSQANFVTVRIPDKERLLNSVAAGGLSVRDGAELGLDDWVRITIGAPPQMALMRSLLTKHEEGG